MKKRIVLNVTGIVLSLSMLVSVSYALFTATASVTGNTLVNGTVSLEITDHTTHQPVLAFGNDPALGFTGAVNTFNGDNVAQDANNELMFAPGDTTSRWLDFKNTGTLDQFYRFYLTNVKLNG